MIADGPRRQGRFLKKGSKILAKASMVDFSFKEIATAETVTHDNSDRSIIHHEYHDPDLLKAGVRSPDRFNDDLLTPEQRRPVLFPLDFTKDWERDKTIRKQRVARADDDDYDFELEAAARQKLAEEEAAEEEAAEATMAPQLAKAAPSNAATNAPAATSPTHPDDRRTPVTDQIDFASKVIMGRVPPPGADETPDIRPKAPAAESTGRRSDEFIPVPVDDHAQAVQDPEAAAAQDYRGRVEEQRISPEELQAIRDQARAEAHAEGREEGRAEGYRDGFRSGEERAEIQGKQNAAAIFGKVSELIHEFSSLKHEILGNVQENFYELCQAMAESLIKREFSIAPESFVTVMRRAIADGVAPGTIKIKVHPSTFDRIAALGPSDIRDALVRDPDIEEGDFKIESNLTVVDVSISKMIEDLLKQADLNIFQTEEKAG